MQGEFPQHDWRRTTLGHRYSFLAGGEGSPITSGIVKVDHETESWTMHDFGSGHVSRERSSSGASWGNAASRGVSNVPGAIVFTRTPRLARSRAAGNVRPTIPPLDAE